MCTLKGNRSQLGFIFRITVFRHTVTEESDSVAVSLIEVCWRLTFSLDWPQDAGSDAVDRALAPPTKDSRERYVKSSYNLKLSTK